MINRTSQKLEACAEACVCDRTPLSERHVVLRLAFSLKPKEMTKMRFLAIWINKRYFFTVNSKKFVISHEDSFRSLGNKE